MTTSRITWTALAGLLLVVSPAAAQEAPSLKDDKEKSSYAVGMNLGGALRRQSPDLDVNLIVQGFKDALAGEKTLLTAVEMRTILSRLQAELKTKQAAQQSENAAKSRSEGDAPPDGSAAATVSALAGINVAFKLDPRITRGLYMGDRWVPLPYTQIGEAKQVTVEARAEGVDDKGKAVSVSPEWTPADPAMVTVTPGRGNAVKITALRPGESSLQVTSQGVSRGLAVKAAYKGEVLQVEIAQKQ